MVDKGIENLAARGLGSLPAPIVVDVIQLAAAVLGFEVVPVLAAHEHACVVILQRQVMGALEDGREGLSLLEIQAAIVGVGRVGLAAVVDPDQIIIDITGTDAGTHGYLRVELTLYFAQIETYGVGRQGDGYCDRHGQWLEHGIEGLRCYCPGHGIPRAGRFLLLGTLGKCMLAFLSPLMVCNTDHRTACDTSPLSAGDVPP